MVRCFAFVCSATHCSRCVDKCIWHIVCDDMRLHEDWPRMFIAPTHPSFALPFLSFIRNDSLNEVNLSLLQPFPDNIYIRLIVSLSDSSPSVAFTSVQFVQPELYVGDNENEQVDCLFCSSDRPKDDFVDGPEQLLYIIMFDSVCCCELIVCCGHLSL